MIEIRAVRLLQEAGLQDVVTLKRSVVVDIERLNANRTLKDGTRYLRISPVPYPDRVWDYEVLGGLFGSSDPNADFDARRGGDADCVIDLIKLWLVDLAEWPEPP